MKTCPFCAESLQDGAIVCKHCGRELDPEAVRSVEASQRDPTSVQGEDSPETMPEWTQLPPEYAPPREHIEAIYRLEQESLKSGYWRLAALPGTVPRRMRPKAFFKFQEKIVKRAWGDGGQTSEGASAWLDDFIQSERSSDKRNAARVARAFFVGKTKRVVREHYMVTLEEVLSFLVDGRHGKSEILDFLEQFRDSQIPKLDQRYRPFVFDEARRIIRELLDFPPEELPESPSIEVIIETVAEIVALMERDSVTRDNLRGTGYSGIVSLEEAERAIGQVTKGNPYFLGGRNLQEVRTLLGRAMTQKGLFCESDELLQKLGYR